MQTMNSADVSACTFTENSAVLGGDVLYRLCPDGDKLHFLGQHGYG